ncbi:hypothetical protein [Aeromonas hydrophila]
MSELDPVILAEVNRGNSLAINVLHPLISGISGAVVNGVTPAVGMSAQFPSTKPLLQSGSAEWLRSGVIAPRESYLSVPDFLTLLGTTYGSADNSTLPASVAIVSVAVAGPMVIVSTSTNATYVSKDRGITWTLASGVASQAVFEANGFIYASTGSSLKRTVNGDAWEVCSGFSSSLIGVSYGNGVYVAVPSASESVCWTSSDGISFVQRTLGSGATAKTGLCFINGFFLVSPAGNVAGPFISYDGITWTVTTLAAGQTPGIYCVLAAGDKALAFTNSGVFESVDGSNWSKAGALPTGFTTTNLSPKCFYSDGLIGVLGTTSLLLSNHPSSFVSVAFAAAIHAASVSGDYLVGGVQIAGTGVYRRKLNRFVGSPKFVDGLYYRVK